MTDAQTFLMDFWKDMQGADLDKDLAQRQKITAGWAKVLRTRDAENYNTGLRKVISIPADTIIGEDGKQIGDVIYGRDVKQLLIQERDI